MQSPRLPPETLGTIFDYVAQPFPDEAYNFDRADYTESELAFKRCFLALALVCRDWYDVAYPYLNRILSIRFRPGLTARNRVGLKGLPDILHWVDTQLPPASVRRLRLIMTDQPVESDDKSDESSNKSVESSDELVLRGCDPSLVLALLRRFRNVHTIELFNLVFDHKQAVAHASTITAEHVPISLNTLVLACAKHQLLPADVVQLCTAWFGTVSAFIVRDDSEASLIGGRALESLPARLAAHTLTVNIPGHKGVMDRLRHSPTFGNTPTLRVLHAMFLTFLHNNIDTFVKPAASVLEELHLDFTSVIFSRPANPAHAIAAHLSLVAMNLRPLLCLRELTVQLASKRHWFAVLHIIGTLSHPQAGVDGRGLPPLRCVTLVPQVLRGEEGITAYNREFARVSTVLAGVPTLERCTLNLRKVHNASDMLEHHKAWFNEHMAELHRRDLLRFVS
ncbi:hypothetical protein BDW22DRAFT_1356615 [Trametopsis cervina]|nr:hypothetical protein BDW22DRAFT_1356615 [Trametopsis cervina]